MKTYRFPLGTILVILIVLNSPFSARAQIGGAPSAADVSPTTNTDVSTQITTGCGYDAWTGSAIRSVTDFDVPGAVSEHGLKWTRTWNSSTGLWSFAYTWRYTGRTYNFMNYPDGRTEKFGTAGNKDRVLNLPKNVEGDTQVDVVMEDGSDLGMDCYTQELVDGGPYYDYMTPERITDRNGRVTVLQWASFDGTYPTDNIQLQKVTDPSGRFITITYGGVNQTLPTEVDGSNGDWVKYTWSQSPNLPPSSSLVLTEADYSDGTKSTYTYGIATYTTHDANGNPTTSPWVVLTSATDTRANSPMQSISYEYYSPGDFQGQIKAEHHLNPDMTAGVMVSSADNTITRADLSGIRTETRGDAAVSRQINMVKFNSDKTQPPLVMSKQDYNGVQETFAYDTGGFLQSVTDRNGYQTTYSSTTNPPEPVINNPTRITHPDTTHIDYTYGEPLNVGNAPSVGGAQVQNASTDADNPYYISTVTDENGKTTTYKRDDTVHTVSGFSYVPHLITEIDYPDQAVEKFVYNNFGQVTTHQRKNGAFEYATYDSTGLLTGLWNATTDTAVANPSDPHTIFTYYPAGNAWQDRVQTVTDPNGNVTTYEYDRDNSGTAVAGRGLVTKITNPDNSTKTFTYDQFGNKLSETDELGHTNQHIYDDYMRLRTTTDALGNVTTLDYTATNGNSSYTHTTKSMRFHTTPPTPEAPNGIVTAQTFDNNLRLATKTEAYGTSKAATTSYGYDNNGNVTSIISPNEQPGQRFAGQSTTNVYDGRNRKISSTDPLNQITSWEYYPASEVHTITRPDKTVETKTYDPMHRVLTDTDPLNRVTQFKYNPSGTLQWVEDANQNYTTFEYDSDDLKTNMIFQNGDQEVYAYDNDHNLKWRQTVAGVYQVFTYDNRNRKTSMGWHNSTDPNSTDVSWANGTDKSTFQYDAASRLTVAANGFSTVQRQYDDANRLTHDTQLPAGIALPVVPSATLTLTPVPFPTATPQVTPPTLPSPPALPTATPQVAPPVSSGSAGFDVQYTYDGDGKVTAVSIPQMYDLGIIYDAMGRMSTLSNSSLGNIAQYNYDPSSNITERDTLPNSSKSVYHRDALNRIYQRDVALGTNTISSEAYTFDPLGMSRLINVSRTEDGKSDAFGYSAAGEMTSAQYGLVNGTPVRSVSYTLDKVGNRTNVTDGEVSTNYSPDNINRYTQVGSDAVGSGPDHQVGSYQNNAYAYVSDTYLAQITQGTNTYTLGYDALGRCVKRTLGNSTTYYIYDGDKAIYEVNLGTNATATNVYGVAIDEIVLRTVGSTNYYYYQDHEGSVTHVATSSGLVEQYRYDAFGAPTIKDGSGNVLTASAIGNRFMFTGREYQSTFGIYEYRNRAYHPGLGRFMSEDPKGFAAGDYNLFRYCKNDPEELTDPMGLISYNSIAQMAASPVSDGMMGTDPDVAADERQAYVSQAVSDAGAGNVTGALNMLGLAGFQLSFAQVGQTNTQDRLAGTEKKPIGQQFDNFRQAAGTVLDSNNNWYTAQQNKGYESNWPIGRVDATGGYVSGEFVKGMGVIPEGKEHAGDQGSAIGSLPAHLPIGTHLVGYATIHPHWDPEKIIKNDIPAFERGYNIPARIMLKAPYNWDWTSPKTGYFGGHCEYCGN